MGYRGYGLPISEIVAEGNVGLMQAVKRFEPDRGFRLATYAMWWIRAAIQEYILRSWSLVKMGTTAAQKKLFFNLRKAKTKINALEEGDLSPEHVADIADKLGVTRTGSGEHEPPPFRAGFLAQRAAEIGRRIRMAGLAGRRHARSGNPHGRIRGAGRAQGIAAIGARRTDRARARHPAARRLQDDPATLEELSQKYGVSRERVRQIEVRAFDKLQQQMKRALAEKRGHMTAAVAH